MEARIHEIIDLIETGKLNILRRVIRQNNFNLNQIGTESGIAALHYATGLDGEQRAIHTCSLLIELGANVNIETKYDQVTPLHIAVEKNYADLLEIFLSHGGDLEVRNNENDTPISLAIEHKHENIIEKIVEHVKRKKRNSRLEALRASQACLTPSKRTSPSPAILNTNSPYYVDLRSKTRPQIVIQDVIEISDSDSEADEKQYYTPEERASVNLFELTRENLEEFTKSNRVRNRQRRSLVSRWCDNLRRCDRPEAIINNLAKIAKVVTGYANDTAAVGIPEDAEGECVEDDNVIEEEEEESDESEEFIDLCVPEESPEKQSQLVGMVPNIIVTSPDHSLESSIPGGIQFPTSDLTRSPPAYHNDDVEIEDLLSEDEERVVEQPPVQIYHDESQHDGPGEEVDPVVIEISESHSKREESIFDESNFIKSPKADDGNSIVQLVEEYEHRDPELGMKFYELKLVANNRYSSQSVTKLVNLVGSNKNENLVRSGSPNSTQSSIISTAISVPLDYDTDTLREELKSFGYTPGPITKSTKRLYLRKLFRYKKNPRRVVDQRNDTAVQYFSVELQHTLKPNLKDSIIQEYGKLEQEMELSFRGDTKKWRQGNAKKSFIYLLIDPRISQNLPGIAPSMEPHEIWRQFLSSIFYVGKGKSSRPYAHLYEAMELSRKETTVTTTIPASSRKIKDRPKVERILDIWQSQNGVVCLQVFHNIIPTEAFSREAVIIEALGIRSLTNLKAGEFYGICQSWPNRKKKHLGIYLLFKALKMFLLEGESQISPDNL